MEKEEHIFNAVIERKGKTEKKKLSFSEAEKIAKESGLKFFVADNGVLLITDKPQLNDGL